MNFILISPYFPANFYGFAVSLKAKGVNTLAIGEEPYEALSPELRAGLTEYYRVASLENYDQVHRACGFFTHKYGRIDRIESHNEHWLELDARLRVDFNVPGLTTADLKRMKYKSAMKSVFLEAGIKAAPGAVVLTAEDAIAFTRKHGFPVVVKPDNGVGASGTYKMNCVDELNAFLSKGLDTVYFIEAFVTGKIITFDGLTDQDGNIVFSSSLVYGQGIMETVNENMDIHYYIPRELPAQIVEAGEKSVMAFGLKERFFHLEYFLTADNEVYALEINVRPPGGLTVDMFNFANDINIFDEYANVVTENRFSAEVKRPYNCFYVGRKTAYNYLRSPEEVYHQFPEQIIYHNTIASIFSAAIGNYGFLVRTPDLQEGFEIAQIILEKQ
jgi:biotin carboxylase